jgi:hypothetical protein
MGLMLPLVKTREDTSAKACDDDLHEPGLPLKFHSAYPLGVLSFRSLNCWVVIFPKLGVGLEILLKHPVLAKATEASREVHLA